MAGPRDRIGAPALDDAGHSARPERGTAADLRLRLQRLPPGHPSSPAADDRRLADQPPRLDSPERTDPDGGCPPDSWHDPEDGHGSKDGQSPRVEHGLGDGQRPRDGQGPEDGHGAVGRLDLGERGPGAEPSPEAWQREVADFRASWEEISARWSREPQPPPDRRGDEPGSWRGDSGRTLSPEQNRQVDAFCDDVSDREQQITARLEDLERTSPGHLVGKEFRRKGPDRLKDKVSAVLEHNVGADVQQVLADVPDVIRYTLQYGESYTQGVRGDIAGLRAEGFELVKLKNRWGYAEYKGINSQWLDRATGLHLEVQFHTPISFEAKQITHVAYEGMRNPRTANVEVAELSHFQQEVSAQIPIPLGALGISEFP